MTAYPDSIKNFTTKSNTTDAIDASHINDLQNELHAVEAELGANPKGSDASLSARVKRLDDSYMGHPMEFPYRKMIRTATPQTGASFDEAGQATVLLDKGRGESGVVREIHIALTGTDMLDYTWLDVFYPDQEITTTISSVASARLNVPSTTGFPDKGEAMVILTRYDLHTRYHRFTYTGRTQTAFTGVVFDGDIVYPIEAGDTISSVSVSVALSDIVAMRGTRDEVDSPSYSLSPPTGPQFDTKYFSMMINIYNLVIGLGNPGNVGMTLRFPIPYSDGIKLQLRSKMNCTQFSYWYSSLAYQDNLPASAWNRNYRMKSQTVDALVVQDATSANPLSKVTFLDVPAGRKGVVLHNTLYIGPEGTRRKVLNDGVSPWQSGQPDKVVCSMGRVSDVHTNPAGQCQVISVPAGVAGVVAFVEVTENLSTFNGLGAWIKSDYNMPDLKLFYSAVPAADDSVVMCNEMMPTMTYGLIAGRSIRTAHTFPGAAPSAVRSIGVHLGSPTAHQMTLYLEQACAINSYLGYLENQPEYYVDRGSELTYEWAGLEDYYGGAWYWDGQGPRGTWGGLGYNDPATGTFHCWHTHETDPIFFEDGIKAVWRNKDTDGGPGHSARVHFTTLYFEEKS